VDDRGSVMGFSLLHSVPPALGPIQPSIQLVPGALSPEIKRPECETDHSPLPYAKVKNACTYTSTPLMRLHGMVLN
jgi:hypothetical protein